MITRNRILFILGLAVVLMPFLGFPSSFESVFSVIFGLSVAVLAFLYARDKRMSLDHQMSHQDESVVDSYVQSHPVFQDEPVFRPDLQFRESEEQIRTPVN